MHKVDRNKKMVGQPGHGGGVFSCPMRKDWMMNRGKDGWLYFFQ